MLIDNPLFQTAFVALLYPLAIAGLLGLGWVVSRLLDGFAVILGALFPEHRH